MSSTLKLRREKKKKRDLLSNLFYLASFASFGRVSGLDSFSGFGSSRFLSNLSFTAVNALREELRVAFTLVAAALCATCVASLSFCAVCAAPCASCEMRDAACCACCCAACAASRIFCACCCASCEIRDAACCACCCAACAASRIFCACCCACCCAACAASRIFCAVSQIHLLLRLWRLAQHIARGVLRHRICLLLPLELAQHFLPPARSLGRYSWRPL